MTSAPPAWSRFIPPLVLGAALRLAFLTRQPLWVDEILTLRAASIGEPFRFHDVLINPQGPLPHVLLRLWTAILGSGDLSLRLWSALAGILVLFLGAVVFRRLAPRASVIGVWLLALSPFQLWYSLEVRNYIFLLAATLLVMGTFDAARREGGARRWFLHALSLAALLLCNLSGVFLLAPLGAALLLDRSRKLLPWIAAALVGLAAAAPWLQVSFGGHMEWSGVTGEALAGEPIRGGNTFDLMAVPYSYMTFLGGYGLGPPPRSLHEGAAAVRWLPLLPGLLLALAGCAWGLGAAFRHGRDARGRLLWLVAFLPVILAAGVALAGLKAFNPRYIAVSQPAFLLLLAVGLAAVLDRGGSRGWILGALLVAPMLLGGARQVFDPAWGREDFRSAARFLEARVAAGDLVLEQGVNGPLERYYRGAAPLATYFPVYFRGEREGEAKLEEMIAGRRTVWWVGSRLWYEDPDRRVLGWVRRRGSERVRQEFPGVEVIGIETGGAPR